MSESLGVIGSGVLELRISKDQDVKRPVNNGNTEAGKDNTTKVDSRSVCSDDVEDLSSSDESFGVLVCSNGVEPEGAKTNQDLVDEESSSDDEWQTMEAIASYDVYDNSGKLAIPKKIENSSETIRSSHDFVTLESVRGGREGIVGYTKAAGEDQAQRAYATNKKTDFLFTKINNSMGSFATASTSDVEEDRTQHMQRSTQDQLSLTKNFLNEKERYAYLGAITVLINEMCTQLAKICISSKNVANNKKLARRLQNLQKNMADWKLYLSNMLYSHIDVSKKEIDMIEKLSLHGIALQDLCKYLKTSRVIENPWSKDASEIETTGNVKGIIKQETFEIDVAWTVVCDLFLLLVQDSEYDARSRTLLIRFAKLLDINRIEICEFEKQVTDLLEIEQSTENQVWSEQELMDGRRKDRRKKKLAYVGLATIGGSLVLGLSGGLLAPVIGAGLAAGLSTIGVTSAAGFLTGVGGTTVVAVSSTAIGANIGRKAMTRRMGDVKTFDFRPLHNNRRVNLIISVSGWMIGKVDDVRLPFSPIDPIEGDLYSLYWEPDMLKSTGQTIAILASEIVTQTIQQILGATVLTALMAAIQVPNLLSKLGYIIDNPWNVSLDRAWTAGFVLADTLISRNLGKRPISLIGFSLGSRVIYSCLLELSKKGALGLVEDVYLFGSPWVYNRDEMVLARAVVSGRFVNGYSERDWVLGYLFRATGGGLQTFAGISPIKDLEGIENMNCTELVEGHMAYRKNIPSLLKRLGVSVLSEEFTEIDDSLDPEQVKRERKLVSELQDVQNKLNSKNKKRDGERASWIPKWLKPERKQSKEISQRNIKAHNNSTDTIQEYDKSNTVNPEKGSYIDNTDILVEGLQHLKEVVQNEVKETNLINEKPVRMTDAQSPTNRANSIDFVNSKNFQENVTYVFADDI